MFFFLETAELTQDILVLIDPVVGKFHYYRIGATTLEFLANAPLDFRILKLGISNFKSSVSVALYKMFPETVTLPSPSNEVKTPVK